MKLVILITVFLKNGKENLKYNYSKMQDLKWILHLTHLWFDEADHPEFEKKIKVAIDSIADKTNIILNIVDETLFTPEELENVQISYLADTLANFIGYYQAWGMCPALFEENKKGIYLLEEKWYPKEIFEYLHILLNWIWQKLKESVEYENNPNMHEDIIKHDRVFHEFYRDHFQNVLVKMIYEFHWKNPFKKETSYHIKNPKTKNTKRRLKLEEYALQKLWENRVIFSWMNDWEYDRITRALFEKYEPHPMNQIHEELFWNATEYVSDVNKYVDITRYDRLKKCFFEAIEERWFQITDNTTHILWWEYYNRCVDAYWSLLELYNIPREKLISISDLHVTLENPEDKLIRETGENIANFEINDNLISAFNEVVNEQNKQ